MFYARVIIAALLICICTTSHAARSYGGNHKQLSQYTDETGTIFLSFNADRTTVAPGDTVKLSWAATGTRWCSASGNWSGKKSTSGTYTTSPIQNSSTFTLTCKTKNNSTRKSIAVVVEQPEPEPAPEPIPEPEPAPVPAPELRLTVDQTEVDDGGTVTLNWESSHAESCEASGDWSGARAASGTQRISLNVDSTFILNCSNATSTVSNMVSVAVRNLDISWQPPTENVDGTALTDLGGFRVYSVEGPEYLLEADIPSAAQTSVALAKPSGDYDFVMTAYDELGNESGYSNLVRKTSP
jgi:plastocyanin